MAETVETSTTATSSASIPTTSSTGRITCQNNHSKNFVDIPSLQNVETIEQLQAKATELLEITADGFVNCQGCGSSKPLIADDWKLPISGDLANRIGRLKTMIAYGERYHTLGDCNKEREELVELLKLQERQQKNILRRLPLHNTRLTGYRWVCGTLL